MRANNPAKSTLSTQRCVLILHMLGGWSVIVDGQQCPGVALLPKDMPEEQQMIQVGGSVTVQDVLRYAALLWKPLTAAA